MEKHRNLLSACLQEAQMRLSDQPALQMIPEWKKQYICYEVSLGAWKHSSHL